MGFKSQILSALLFSSLLIASSGCATQIYYRVNVDSIRDESYVQNKKYVLLPANEGITDNDLQFKEFSGYVRRALAANEYEEIISFEEAELAIYLGYGISEPQSEQSSYSTPVWGQTGFSSYYNAFYDTIVYTPSYGITGYESHVETLTTYSKFIFLDAYDLTEKKDSQDPVQVWKTTVTSTGPSGDLRKVFPILVAASKDYIGANTGEQLTINICETDEAVLDIKMVPENPETKSP